jgi:hypothetical protein
MLLFINSFSAELVQGYDPQQMVTRLYNEFAGSYGSLGMILGSVIGFVCTIILKYFGRNRILLIVAEILACGMVFLPILLPWKAARFFYGLYIFVAAMSLHSRIFEALQWKRKTNATSAIDAAMNDPAKETRESSKKVLLSLKKHSRGVCFERGCTTSSTSCFELHRSCLR